MINALLKSLSPDLTCNISNINILKKMLDLKNTQLNFQSKF